MGLDITTELGKVKVVITWVGHLQH
jgi:hypothetical protein